LNSKEGEMNKVNTEQTQKFDDLKQIDTPTITNVVAGYPSDTDMCLGLYNPWTCNWYTDQSIKCMFPELGPRAGYAVTVQYGLPDPNYKRLGFGDVLKAIENSPKPVVVVMEQRLPEEIKDKNGLCGGNMVTAMKALGCIGMVTNGPSRDVNEVREMGFQYMLTGVSAGHGDFAVEAVNVPVSVCGMDVCPGEIVHIDENGACKFPADKLDDVLRLSKEMLRVETERMEKMRNSSSAEQIIHILNNFEDSSKPK
jgi:4-hydroxy-4-methyl-2-oxoglutarate aldolase